MKKLLSILAVFCLLASSSHVNAQLIIRNNGHAEIGVNPATGDVLFDSGFCVEVGASLGVYPSNF